jgi:hypothetical protein
MRTKALASALILFGSTAALAQVADTQDAPVENNVQAEEAWDGSTTPEPTEPVPADETTPPAPTEEPTGEPSEDDLTTPPTDPVPPQG